MTPSHDPIRQVEAESVDSWKPAFGKVLSNYNQGYMTEVDFIAHIESIITARVAAERERLMSWEKVVDLSMSADWMQRAIKAAAALAASQAAPEKYKLTDADRAALAEASTAGLSVARLPDAGIAFINHGHDYGDNADLHCEACGGSGHSEDFNVWKASQAAPAKAEGNATAWFCVNSVTGKMVYTDSRSEAVNMRDQKEGRWTVTPLFPGKPETPSPTPAKEPT